MGKSFLPDDVNQSLLFPPSLHDWLPENHLARFLVDVVSALDLSAIYVSYADKDGRGRSAYAPAMLVRVLLYGYATGVYSSRKIEARTYEDVDAVENAQIIVAAEVTQETTDNHQLVPMLSQVEQNLGRRPEAASDDAG